MVITRLPSNSFVKLRYFIYTNNLYFNKNIRNFTTLGKNIMPLNVSPLPGNLIFCRQTNQHGDDAEL